MNIELDLVRRAKDLLGEKTADIIAELSGMRQYNPNKHTGCCINPTHNDQHPSCSFNPKTHSFHCFSCGYSIDIIDAFMAYEHLTFSEACEKLFSMTGIQADFSERGVISKGKYDYPHPKYADNIDIAAAYWEKRKISRKTLEYAGVMQDTEGNTLFQYYNDRDVLVGCKVRLSRAVKHGETKCWWNGENPNILYNFNKLQSDKPLIITSGEGDALAAIECGYYNVASINGGDQNTQWISNCWEFLQKVDEIILVHDNDESGRKFAKEVSTRLGDYRVCVVEIPKFYTASDGRKIEINDLNELLFRLGKQAVQDAIQNARETDIPSIVDYSDIEKFDMSDMDGFVSGFHELDRSLGKFYLGSTNILTGICGSGKSSFLSSIVCQSVEQGFPAFVYSGELSNPSLKNWIDCVHAGQNGVEETRVEDSVYYKIKPDTYRKINSYYAGKIFIYRDSYNSSVTALFSAMESVVRKKGVKTIVIDNMSVIDLENDDNNKWMKQDTFVRDMIEFSRKWQVAAFIVLHPRKMDMVRRMNLFDLQGVVSAVNLAHRVIALYRTTPRDKEGVRKKDGTYIVKPMTGNVVLDILKDRFGSASGKSFPLWYDVPSRRFYDNPETLSYRYGFDNTTYETALPFGSPSYDEDHTDDSELFGNVQNDQ